MSLPQAEVGHSRRPTNLKNSKSKPPSPHVDHDMSRMARPSMDITSTVPPHITSPLPTTINNLKLNNLRFTKFKPPAPVDHNRSEVARPSMDITSTVSPHITSPLPTINKLKNLRFTKSKPPAPVDHDRSKVARSSVNNTSTPPPYMISSLPNIAGLLEQAKLPFRLLLFQVGRDRLAWVTLNGATAWTPI